MADTTYIKDNLSGSVPTEIANTVIKNIVKESISLKICNHTDMTSDTKKIPMLKDNGKAYWVDEGEEISTSIHNWEYPELKAKKLAVIVPCTKEKLNDSVLNVMDELKQGISDAFVRALDGAVLFGTDSPFDTNICETASNIVNMVKGHGLDTNISDAMSKIEEKEFIPNAIIAPLSMKGKIRLLRDTNGNALVVPGGISGCSSIYETPIHYPPSNVFDNTKAELLVGDFSKAMIGTREGITYEILKEATVNGINLAVRDMIAIKCTMRVGFKVLKPDAFSVLKSEGGFKLNLDEESGGHHTDKA